MVGTPVTEYTSETNIAATFKNADIVLVQECKILQHLRHQFGTKTLATRTNVQMFCKGHSPMKIGFTMHAYTYGKSGEHLYYSYKDRKKEVEV